jgi:hypothetical protein
MQRDMYNTVTMPIIVRSSEEWAEGTTYRTNHRVWVREFTADDADQSIPCGKENWNELSASDRREIVWASSFIPFLKLPKSEGVTILTLTVKNPSISFPKMISKEQLNPAGSVYMADVRIPSPLPTLGRELDRVRLVIWERKDGTLAPGLFCPDVRSAFWILALWSAVGMKAGPRLCPKCGRLFGQTRPDQEYCSLKCREAHRVQRWREQQKTRKSTGKTKSRKKAP